MYDPKKTNPLYMKKKKGHANKQRSIPKLVENPLPETNSSPLKMCHSKRKSHLPTIHFQVGKC